MPAEDVSSWPSETAAPPPLSQTDLEEANITEIAAPLAAIRDVLDLSEEVADRIASDNDALTDAFAQAMEQSAASEDSDSQTAPPSGKLQIGLIGTGACVAAAALVVAVVRRVRRSRNRPTTDKATGSTKGSRCVSLTYAVRALAYPSE